MVVIRKTVIQRGSGISEISRGNILSVSISSISSVNGSLLLNIRNSSVNWGLYIRNSLLNWSGDNLRVNDSSVNRWVYDRFFDLNVFSEGLNSFSWNVLSVIFLFRYCNIFDFFLDSLDWYLFNIGLVSLLRYVFNLMFNSIIVSYFLFDWDISSVRNSYLFNIFLFNWDILNLFHSYLFHNGFFIWNVLKVRLSQWSSLLLDNLSWLSDNSCIVNSGILDWCSDNVGILDWCSSISDWSLLDCLIRIIKWNSLVNVWGGWKSVVSKALGSSNKLGCSKLLELSIVSLGLVYIVLTFFLFGHRRYIYYLNGRPYN